MFSKQNRQIDELETRLKRLEEAWERELIDLSDIKQQVLRTLNRLIGQERRRAKEKPPEDAPGDTNEGPKPTNPLALGILQRRR